MKRSVYKASGITFLSPKFLSFKVLYQQIMIGKSQTVNELVEESRKKFKEIMIDAPLRGREKEFFEKAAEKLDPSIYKGEFKSYKDDKGNNYESSLEKLKKMYEKSDTLDDWVSRERSNIENSMAPNQRGYDFKRDTVPSYSGKFEDIAKQYLMSEGRELYAHLKGKGRDFYEITRVGTADLGSAVAALASNGHEAALLGSKNFDAKVSQLAAQYGVSKERAVTYVLSHEFVHASQKGKGYDDPILAELDVEHTLKEYFTKKGDHDLAAIASDRANNVTKNYSSAGSYRVPGASKYFGKESSSAYGSGIGTGKGYSGSSAGGIASSAGSYSSAACASGK